MLEWEKYEGENKNSPFFHARKEVVKLKEVMLNEEKH